MCPAITLNVLRTASSKPSHQYSKKIATIASSIRACSLVRTSLGDSFADPYSLLHRGQRSLSLGYMFAILHLRVAPSGRPDRAQRVQPGSGTSTAKRAARLGCSVTGPALRTKKGDRQLFCRQKTSQYPTRSHFFFRLGGAGTITSTRSPILALASLSARAWLQKSSNQPSLLTSAASFLGFASA